MKALIAANLFAALPAFIWFYLFRAMAEHYATLPAYGYSGDWDFTIYFPLGMLLIVLMAIALLNFLLRRPAILVLVAGVALLPVLPYAMAISGGV